MSPTQTQNYLKLREAELRGTIEPRAIPVLEAGFAFIKVQMAGFDSVTPDVARKIELLECLLMGFVDHVTDLTLLESMDAGLFRAPKREWN